MASGPITTWQTEGEKVEIVTDFLILGSKITADGESSYEIRRHVLLGRKMMTNLDSVLKSRHITLPTKVRIVKAMVFPVVRYSFESWTVKKAECQRIDAFKLWCWRRLLKVLKAARRSNQSILREINLEYSLEGLILKLKLQYTGHLTWTHDSLEKFLMLGKTEGRKRASEDEMVNMNLGKLWEMVRDRQAWRAAVYGVTKSWTWLGNWTTRLSGSKLGKGYVKAIYCHPAYLTCMQSTSCKMLGWVNHKLESRLTGEISTTSGMQMTPPLWQKAKRN